ncbi:MAG: hypothetical protein IJC59_02850 [Lachnospiraceae bacterium]|nr:hypothetical protein [Lachnospiraceae bacterium]
MKRRIAVLLAAAMLLTASLTGCGEKVTAESLMEEAQEKFENVKSYRGSMDMDMVMTMKEESLGMNMELGLVMDAEYSGTTDPEIVHMKGTLGMDLMGLSMDLESYSAVEGDKLISYTNTAGTWTKTEEPYSEEGMQDMTLSLMEGMDMTLAEETEMLGDREVYVLTYTVSGDTMQEVMDSMDMMQELMDSMEGFDLSQLTMDVTMKIYKDSRLPAASVVSMSTTGEGMSLDGVTVGFEKVELIMSYDEYDTIDSITIPEEALEAELLEL